MKRYRWSVVAAIPLVASLLASSASAQAVCDWYGFAVPRDNPVASDVVISSTTSYNAWATSNGRRVVRLHFQSQCRVTAQVDPGRITAVPAAELIQDSSAVVESTNFTVTFYTAKGVEFDQVVFKSVYQKYMDNAMVTTDPIVDKDETVVHLPQFQFDAKAYRRGLPVAAHGNFGGAQVYEMYCKAEPVIPNLYGFQTEYSSETGRATRLYAGPNNPPEPVSYAGGAFPEQSLWNASAEILRRFDPEYIDVDNLKIDPSQLIGKQLGSMYYLFDLARKTACYVQQQGQ